MRIDAHFHLWDLDRHEHSWTRESPVLHRSYRPADLRPALAAAGVGRAVLVQTVPEPWETPELLALAEDEEFIGAVVGWSDLTDPELPAALDRLRALPGGRFLTGLRHNVQDEPGTAWFARPEVRHGCARSARRGSRTTFSSAPTSSPPPSRSSGGCRRCASSSITRATRPSGRAPPPSGLPR